MEVAADVALADGLRLTASYIRNDQFYTDYSEVVAGAGKAASRDGNKIPGISPNEFTTRLSYDFAQGSLKGIGAFVEYEWHDGFFMENANLLKAPGYELVNVNVHYNKEFASGPVRSLMTYFEIKNLFDETYISSANNISDRISGNLADAHGLDLRRCSAHVLRRHESEVLSHAQSDSKPMVAFVASFVSATAPAFPHDDMKKHEPCSPGNGLQHDRARMRQRRDGRV